MKVGMMTVDMRLMEWLCNMLKVVIGLMGWIYRMKVGMMKVDMMNMG